MSKPTVSESYRYSRIPRTIESHTRLQPAAKLVYGAMLGYQGKREYCFASQDRIADRLALDRKTVCRSIAALIQERLVESITDSDTLEALTMRGGYRAGLTNVYRCLVVIQASKVVSMPRKRA